jgi:hypothetical protein
VVVFVTGLLSPTTAKLKGCPEGLAVRKLFSGRVMLLDELELSVLITR